MRRTFQPGRYVPSMTATQLAVLKSLLDGTKTTHELYALISPGRVPRKGPTRGGPDGAQVVVHFYCARHLLGLVVRVLEPPAPGKPNGWFGDRYEITIRGREVSDR
jgi:hypothetical protein